MVVAIVDGWPRAFDPFPCRRSARFQIPMLAGARWSPLAGFSPSATPAAFLFLFFIPAQIVAVNGPVPPYPSFPRAVVSDQFPFYLHTELQCHLAGCLTWQYLDILGPLLCISSGVATEVIWMGLSLGPNISKPCG